MKKVLIICSAAAAVAAITVIALICIFSVKNDEPQATAVSATEIKVTDGDVSRGGFISMCMYLYEQLSGEIVVPEETNGMNQSESVKKAYALGVIDENDAAVYSDEGVLTREEAAVLLYTVMVKYDPTAVLERDAVNSVLNSCYDNMSLTYRDACAFVMQTGAVRNSFCPSKLLASAEAAEWVNTVYSLYKHTHSVTFADGRQLANGDTAATLVKSFGEPQRIDNSFYGVKNYIYNTDDIYLIAYVDKGVVRGFFANFGVKESTDVFGDIANGGGAYYRADNTRDDNSTAVMRETEQLELFEMIDAYHRSKGLGRLVEHTSLVQMAVENSRIVSDGGRELVGPEKCAVVRGASAEDMYIQLVSSQKYSGALDMGGKRDAYAGVGLWYGSVEPCATVLIDEVTAVQKVDETAQPAYTEVPAVYSDEVPVIASPAAEEVLGKGAQLVIRLEKQVSESFIARVVNSETSELVVYARVYGDSIAVSPDILTDGIDYMVTVSTDRSGAELFSETVAVRYGTPEVPEISSPYMSEVTDTDSINVAWKSRYSDFAVTLYNEAGESLGSQRILNTKSLNIKGLVDGLYTVEVSAYRKNTNVVMAAQTSKFLVQLGSVNLIETERPKVNFGTTRYSSVFDGSLVYSSKAEADANMTTVSVPVWKLENSGEKVPSRLSVTVNKALAQQVLEIFTEIYNGDEKFPIKVINGYAWRSTATGTRSQHSYGTCIDINRDENYCVYNSGTTIGKFWKPNENPYSITTDGDVMRAFKSRGWTWGGEWNTVKDYMHFSYLGG